MSELRSKSGDVAIILAPVSIKERGNPTWLNTRIGLRDQQGSTQEVVALTTGDLAELSRGLREVTDSSGRFEMNGQDESFQIRIEPALSAGDFQVGIWIGEPYRVMRGFRIVVEQDELGRFAMALEREAAAVDG